MKLPGLLALGRTFAKAPGRTLLMLDAALPGLRLPPPRAARPPTQPAPAHPASDGPMSAARFADPVRFSATTRSLPAPSPADAREAGAAGRGSPAVSAPAAGTFSAPPRRRRGWWGRRSRDPRQAEMLLAGVQVVRNDLFADDLELVPRPSPAALGLKLGAERSAPSGGWRGWLAHWAHLLGLRRKRHP